ncbi:MAG: hypothetical protein AB7F50_12210 [Fimbriimonadaceae bacterium]
MRLALFLAVLALLDQVVGSLARRAAPPDFQAAVAAKAGFELNASYDVWIVGDSLAADAFVPEVIRRETGLSVFNWGVYASSPAEWEILLRDLEARARFPRLVVLGANPQMLRKTPGAGPYTREFVRSHFLRAELTNLSLFEDDLGAVLASGRSRLLARSALLGLLGRGQKARVHPRPPDDGYLANTRVLPVQARPRSAALPADPRRARLHRAALLRIRAMCKRHGALLIVVEPPVAQPEAGLLAGGPSDQATYREAIHALGAPVFAGSASFGPEDFYDGIHLVDPASRRFSQSFADWLRSQQGL